MKQIFIASDHAGFSLKQKIILYLKNQFQEYKICDLGPSNEDRVDYPDYADKVAEAVQRGEGQGILICGSGQGMAMRANKHANVRAALCWNTESCELSRKHNDANILCLGGRLIEAPLAEKLISIFLKTQFEGGRHQLRIDKLIAPIKK